MTGRTATPATSLALGSGFALADDGASSAAINANIGSAPVGRAPRPSARHAGSVNVAFCDGRVLAVSDQIDPTVYARHLTPAGAKHGQPPLAVDALDE